MVRRHAHQGTRKQSSASFPTRIGRNLFWKQFENRSIVVCKITYLDQNAVINAGLKGRRDDVFREKLNGAITGERLTVVLSAWHWVETSRAPNRSSALQLADFMDSLSPSWLRERRDLERGEVHTSFLKFCNVPFDPPRAVVTRLELIAALNRLPVSLALDCTSRQFVDGWMTNPNSVKPLVQSYLKNADALRNLRKARAEGRVTAEIKREGDRRLIEGFLPDGTPSGVLIDRETKCQFLDSAKLEDFPSLSIESALAEHSWAHTDEPSLNSMVDKFHLISALPYVDCVVSNDKYFHSIVPIATKTGFVRAQVLPFDEFVEDFL
jgi:hypothetical protein